MQAIAPRSLRVLHAVDELGPELQSLLVEATGQLLRAGVQPTLLCCRDPADAPLAGGVFDARVRLVELPASARRSAWSQARQLRRALVAELHAHRYDAVHLHSFAAGVVGRLTLAGRRQHPPVFYSPHGLRCLHVERPWTQALYRTAERMAGWLDGQPVGDNASEAQWLALLTGRVATVLERPVTSALFDLQRQPAKVPLVLCVGPVGEQQGADLVAEVAARFHFAGQTVRFVWVGAGDARCEEVLRASGVEVTGLHDAEAQRAWFAQAHVFLQASRSGGPSLPLLQALAAGVPCVVSDVAVHRDAITHGVTGLLCRDVSAFALKIKALLDAPKGAHRMAQAARREARRRFSLHRFRGELLWLYGLDDAIAQARQTNAGGAPRLSHDAAR
jgi:glycosyltransferase involved in cell wall biosynthesis